MEDNIQTETTFVINLEAITGEVDPKKCIKENTENIYRSVRVRNFSNISHDLFFAKLGLGYTDESIEIKFEQVDDNGRYRFSDNDKFNYDNSSLSGVRIHEFCRNYKEGRVILPAEVKILEATSIIVGMFNEDFDMPSWDITLFFDNGEIDIVIVLDGAGSSEA